MEFIKKFLTISLFCVLPDFAKRLVYFGALFKKLYDADDPHVANITLEQLCNELKLTNHNTESAKLGYFFSTIIFPNIRSVEDLDKLSDMNHLKKEIPKWQRWGNPDQMHTSIVQMKSILAAH